MKVVIVGAGFAGLKIARKLNNKAGFEVILIDRFNYHQFQPLFYQVATATLDASNISFPLRKVFQKSKNVKVRMCTVESVDPVKQRITTNECDYDYDVLILSTGADTNFFGNNNVERHSLPMKSTTEALQLRHRLLQNFEKSVMTKDPAQLEKLLNVVIVGGGATGVELGGAIAEMKRFILPKDFPDMDFSKMNIMLLEGLDRTLAAMSEKSSADSKAYLEKLGVQVMLGEIMSDYDGETVVLKSGKTIRSGTVIWAAGIKGNVPKGIDKDLITRGNRIIVDRYHRVQGFENIYAVGDVSWMETPKYPKGHPQVATVAIQHGDNLAENLLRMERGSKGLYEFEYFDKGSMATVGRNAAVVDLPKPKLHFKGAIAWLMWMAVHLFLLLGMKNRIQVFINWIYKFFTFDQNLRLIFKEYYKEPTIIPAAPKTNASEEIQPVKKSEVNYQSA